MLKEQVVQYLEMLESECYGFNQGPAEKRLVAAVLASYIDDLKEILNEN